MSLKSANLRNLRIKRVQRFGCGPEAALRNLRMDTVTCEVSTMPASIQHEGGSLFRIRISGILRQVELKEVQAVAAREIGRLGTIRLLFVLEDFEGWDRDTSWGDLEFYMAHDKDIERIAIVGEEKWRDHGMAFAGAGIRKAAVQFFHPTESAQARAWLADADRRS
jgi:hypothetical protein